MRPSLVAPTLALITTFAPSVNAIQALANSPCAVNCGNTLSATTGNDIECLDKNYSNSPGSVFKSCVSCQLSSNYVDPNRQTDLQMAMYNMRYAVSWCLYGFPNNTNVGSSPCVIGPSCGPLQSAFTWGSLNPTAPAFEFCPSYHDNTLISCKNCLAASRDKFYLNNFATALQAACHQQPNPGRSISVDGQVFSSTKLNETQPKDETTGSYHPPMGALTLGGKIGIAAAALVVLLAITGFCIIWNGRRRRRRILQKRQMESGYADWRAHHNFEEAEGHGGAGSTPMQDGSSAGGFFDSPASTRPLVNSRPPWPTNGNRGMEEQSPLSAVGEKAYFSPYSSQYSSPTSATEQHPIIGSWPQDRKGSLGSGSALSNALGRTRSPDHKVEREPDNVDRIEMQNVPPVLLHPGNGRGKPANAEDPRGGQF